MKRFGLYLMYRLCSEMVVSLGLCLTEDMQWHTSGELLHFALVY